MATILDTYSNKAQWAVEHVDIEQAAGIEYAEWEGFQLDYLNNPSRFAIDVKARQIAWSFTAALDAFADSQTIPGAKPPYTFISVNLEEAREKIRYVRNIWEAAAPHARPRIIQDSKTSIEFSDGARFISHPCRPPRGKALGRYYLDEMAHYPFGLDGEIYTAAIPGITKGGYVRIGSSPLGASGLFWEIYTQTIKKWPGYVRRAIPWWTIRTLCKDVQTARQVADEMDTKERVYAFGTETLIEIFENMFLEGFQQEFECAWIDELTAWITWEIIKKNQQRDLVWWHARSVDEALQMIADIKKATVDTRIEEVLTGGVDVGRKRNLTEFIATGHGTTNQKPLRFMISLDNVEFDDQESCFEQVITQLPFTQVLIDKNGLGMQLAENLETKTGGVAQGFDFTNPNKELLAVNLRVVAESGNMPIPLNRDLAYQIHSVKKKISKSKHAVFDTEKNEKHHADKFWALALALHASRAGTPVEVDKSPIADYRR